jgi:dienelactone hydrolase
MPAGRVVAIVLSVLALAGCVTVGPTEQAVDASRYWLPGDAVPAKVDVPAAFAAFEDAGASGPIGELPQDVQGRWPAVVLLHGCTGMGGETPRQARVFASLGYAAFAADSFARHGRTAQCHQQNRSHLAMRHDEAEMLHRRISQLPWIDTDRIVLAGHSEGGWAVGWYRGGGFRAAVITGWDCKAPGTLPVAERMPTLVVNNVADPEYRDGAMARCRSSVAGAGNGSRAVLFNRSGHGVAEKQGFETAVRAFLVEHVGAPETAAR